MRSYPLLPYSQLVFDQMQDGADAYAYPSTTWRLLKSDVDYTRLRGAIETALRNHPVFLTTITSDGQQVFCPDSDIFEGKFHFVRIYEQGEYVYVESYVHRILGDSLSYSILLEDVYRAYMSLPLVQDHYIEFLEQREQQKSTPRYASDREYLRREYGSLTCPAHPTTDLPLDADLVPVMGEYVCDLSHLQDYIDKLSATSHLSIDGLVCLSTLLAIMDYCHTDEAALTWAWHGRSTEEEQHIFGSLHRDIPLKLSRKTTHAAYLRDFLAQIRHGIAHSDYPLTLTHPYTDYWNYAVNVLHQPSMADAVGESPIPFEIVPLENAEPQLAYSLLDIEIEDNQGLQLRFRYSSTHYREQSIRYFADLIRLHMDWLLLSADAELVSALEQTMAEHRTANPDSKTNPVQSVEELEQYARHYLTSLPWQGLDLGEETSLFRRIDQSIGYFYYIFGDLQTHPLVARFLTDYDIVWGHFLSGPASWSDGCLRLVQSDPLFALDRYESPDHWHSFNDFFSRRLCENNPSWGRLLSPSDGIIMHAPVKTASLTNWLDLLGDSPYRDCFLGGETFHIVLDMYDYHRFHAPCDGRVLDVRTIDGVHHAGGRIIWDAAEHRYRYEQLGDETFQMMEKRGVLVLQTKEWGKIAIIPVGVAQVSSVNWNESVVVGTDIRQGQELGYFLCGGSDIVLLFEPSIHLPYPPLNVPVKCFDKIV